MNSEIKEKLEKMALEASIPFCYSDHRECKTGKCDFCGSDDLMRLLPGVGCDWGTEWIIEEIINEKLTPINTETMFEELCREIYPETTKIGWIEHDTVDAMKNIDPISWNIAKEEWISEQIDEEIIFQTKNNEYFYTQDLENLIS